MVRCIPTFIILGLLSTFTFNHPIGIENVEEIVETVGVKTVEDHVFDIYETAIPENEATESLEEEIISVVSHPYVVEEDYDEDHTAGIQAIDDNEDNTAGIQAIEDIVGIQGVVEEDDENVDIQVIRFDERDVEEDIEAGIQGVEDVEENDVVEIQAEDSTAIFEIQNVEDSTAIFEIQNDEDNTDIADEAITPSNDVVVQSSNDQFTDDNDNMEFELFEEEPEEITAVAINDDGLSPVQDNENKLSSAYKAAAIAVENITNDVLYKLKHLNMIHSNVNNNKRSNDSENSDSDSDDENNVNPAEPQKTESVFEINETEIPLDESVTETEAIVSDVETDAPVEEPVTELFTNYFEEIPTEFVTEPIEPVENVTPPIEEITNLIYDENSQDDDTKPVFQKRQNDDFVEIALFEIDDEVVKNDFDTVTEMVTEVHVVSAFIDDDQPTIGAIAIDDDIEDEIPLFGVIEEVDEEEVLIAKRSDDIFAELVEDPQADEEVTESATISGVLIDLTEQSDVAVTDAVTDSIDEEPTIIN